MKGLGMEGSLTHLAFEKIHACGNDFLLLEAMPTQALLQELCDRHHGLGADGVMFWQTTPELVVLGHLDPDGSHSLCLNGTRAALHCLGQQGKIPASGEVESEQRRFSYELGPEGVSLRLPLCEVQPYCWTQGSWSLDGHRCDVGNPHFVLHGALDGELFEDLAPQIRWDLERFAQGTNVHLVWGDRGTYRIRSYERGVEGFTLACGSGMYAAALVLLAGQPGQVTFVPDGRGQVCFTHNGQALIMCGQAHWVASGVFRC